ncbi:mRNA export factor Gle1p [Diutina catenulata]
MRFGLPGPQGGVATAPATAKLSIERTKNTQQNDGLVPRTPTTESSMVILGPVPSEAVVHDLSQQMQVHLNVMTPTSLATFHEKLRQLNETKCSQETSRVDISKQLAEVIDDISKTQIDTLTAQATARLQRMEAMTKSVLQNEAQRLEDERQRRLEQERRAREREEARKKEEAKRKAEAEAKAKAEAEAKAKAAAEAKAKAEREAAEKKAERKAAKEAAKEQNKSITNFLRVEHEYFAYKDTIATIKQDVKTKVLNDPGLKKAVNPYKRQLNKMLGQLSDSMQQLQQVAATLFNILEQAQASPMAFKFLLNHLAKMVVDQAETEAGVKLTAALPIARLACMVLQKIPDFEYYLTARFVKKCPYIIGFTCGIESEEGRYRMGWKKTGDGKWEDPVKYEERVSGIAAVWGVMSRLTEYGQLPQFYTYEAVWSFLARMGNTETDKLTNCHFDVVANWWDVAAYQFYSHYGRQSQKLLALISGEWPASVGDKTFSGAKRLQILREAWFNTSRLTPLKEMET